MESVSGMARGANGMTGTGSASRTTEAGATLKRGLELVVEALTVGGKDLCDENSSGRAKIAAF